MQYVFSYKCASGSASLLPRVFYFGSLCHVTSPASESPAEGMATACWDQCKSGKTLGFLQFLSLTLNFKCCFYPEPLLGTPSNTCGNAKELGCGFFVVLCFLLFLTLLFSLCFFFPVSCSVVEKPKKSNRKQTKCIPSVA